MPTTKKPIIQSIAETVESAVDAANRATREFVETHKIIPNAQVAPPQSAMKTRKKQGEGFWQGDIGD